LGKCKAKNRKQRGLVRIPRDEEEVKVKHHRTIKSSSNSQRTSVTRLENEQATSKFKLGKMQGQE